MLLHFSPSRTLQVAADWCRAELRYLHGAVAQYGSKRFACLHRRTKSCTAQNRIGTESNRNHGTPYAALLRCVYVPSTTGGCSSSCKRAKYGTLWVRCGERRSPATLAAGKNFPRLSLQGKTSRDSRCREKLPATLAAGRLTVSAAC
jgi:hypothetical protein